MSTDLGQMTAGQLLDWLMSRQDPPAPWQMAVFRAAGLTDLTVFDHPLVSQAAEELSALTDRGQQTVAPPLAVTDVESICRVGNAVYASDRDNLPEWLAVADLIDRADRTGWRSRRRTHQDWVGEEETRAFIAALLDAGRAPAYARKLVLAAAEHQVSPDTYGFSPEITTAAFIDLATAGLGGYELDRLTAEGITLTEALDFTLAGCPAGAVIAAKHYGLPKHLWKERTAGLNSSWFPLFDGHPSNPSDPLRNGAIGRLGYTWEQLRSLVDHGWGKVSETHLGRMWYGTKGGVVTPTPAQTVQIAEAGVPCDEMINWLKAFTTRSDGFQFLFRGNQLIDQLPLIVELRNLGVTPASLVDYRYCGCDSLGAVLTAAQAGIDARRVKYLRNTYGQAVRERSKRIPTFGELLKHHEQDAPAGAPA